jgi:hypothetical protein
MEARQLLYTGFIGVEHKDKSLFFSNALSICHVRPSSCKPARYDIWTRSSVINNESIFGVYQKAKKIEKLFKLGGALCL